MRLRPSDGSDIGPWGLMETPMITVHFTTANGTTKSVQADAGASLMRAATENGIPGILAECGGSGTCATCHVYVQDEWFERLPAPTDDEQDMIDFAWERKENSRLACQLVLDATMDGLVVKVPSRQA